MADGVYLKFEEQKGLGNIDIESDTFHLCPMDSGYTPDYTNDQFWSDISSDLASGASTIALSNVTFNISGGYVTFDSDDVSESSQTWASPRFVIKKYTGTPTTEVLVACIDFDATQTPVAGPFAYTVPANGYFRYASS